MTIDFRKLSRNPPLNTYCLFSFLCGKCRKKPLRSVWRSLELGVRGPGVSGAPRGARGRRRAKDGSDGPCLPSQPHVQGSLGMGLLWERVEWTNLNSRSWVQPLGKLLERQCLVTTKLYLPTFLVLTFYIWVVLGFTFFGFSHYAEFCLPLSSSLLHELLKCLGFGFWSSTKAAALGSIQPGEPRGGCSQIFLRHLQGP